MVDRSSQTSGDHSRDDQPRTERYGLDRWGQGYVSINASGHAQVQPEGRPGPGIDIKQVVDELIERGFAPPLLLRFTDVIHDRVGRMAEAFARAGEQFDFHGGYRGVYPMKVNQQRQVVEEVLRCGAEHGFGLEVGSKAELLAGLALVQDDQTPIVCNGFKDQPLVEAVVLATKLGRWIVPVIESLSELRMIVDRAKAHQVHPWIGLRIRLARTGAGRWANTGGDRSKFGLGMNQVLEAVEYLRRQNMLDALDLLHFHLGSQVHDVTRIKSAVIELARIYVELRRLGARIGYLDVGGGLAVDYDGSATASESSMNYTLQEYANNLVYHIQSVCEEVGAPHPTIISESGRALSAHHSVLVFNVVGQTGVEANPPPGRFTERDLATMPMPVRTLAQTYEELAQVNALELFHDAQLAREEALNLFSLGYCSLTQRTLAERLFFAIGAEALRLLGESNLAGSHPVPEELAEIEQVLARTYYVNCSIFQSMPDSWAIDQVFPIMPIHRLNQTPTIRATLADITCDSDGKIDRFIGQVGSRPVLDLHPYDGQRYLLGAFLVGAYQETLGDLHNLFGDTHTVHVSMNHDATPTIDEIIQGDRIADVLGYLQFNPPALRQSMTRIIEHAVDHGRLTGEEGQSLKHLYDQSMDQTTYLQM